MIRLMLPLLPFRLAGIMLSTGFGGWKWMAVSLYIGSHRFMFQISGRNVIRGVLRKRRITFLHVRERFGGGVIYLRKVRA